jgi:hypothetical protein
MVTQFADFITFQDESFELTAPAAQNKPSERSFSRTVSDVVHGDRCIFLMRVNPPGGSIPAELTVTINDILIMRQRFDTDPERSWHETFTIGLRDGVNTLKFKLSDPIGLESVSIDIAGAAIIYRPIR